MRSIVSVFRRAMPVVLAVAVLPWLAPAAHAKKSFQLLAPGGGQVRALVVGVNDYTGRSIPTLKGAVADARDLEATFRAAGVSDLTVLIDADATRRNFETAINRVINNSKAGDLVFISFAGHGSQQPELVKGSESDGMDEIFLLRNFDRAGPGTQERIIDDEMFHWLAELNKKKVQVIFIADTCHGGGMLRSADLRSGEVSYRDGGQISISALEDQLKPISTPADAKLSPDDLPNVTFLAAVDKFSKAPEVKVPLDPNDPNTQSLRGALSYAVAHKIREGDNGALTRGEMFKYARQIAYQYSQTKQTISTEPQGTAADLNRQILVLKVSGDDDTTAAAINDVIRLGISGVKQDALSGVRPGQFQFRLVKPGESADVVWDPITGDVLNGYGDVISKSALANDIPAIVDAVGATLAIGKLSEGGVQTMKLLPNDRKFHRGEVIRFHIEDLEGKYLILVNLSGNGRVRFLFPRLKSDVALSKDSTFDLPLRVDEPYGQDYLIAIVSDRRLDQVEANISALDDQKAAGKFADILRSLHQSDRSVRFGMAASFTSQ